MPVDGFKIAPTVATGFLFTNIFDGSGCVTVLGELQGNGMIVHNPVVPATGAKTSPIFIIGTLLPNTLPLAGSSGAGCVLQGHPDPPLSTPL